MQDKSIFIATVDQGPKQTQKKLQLNGKAITEVSGLVTVENFMVWLGEFGIGNLEGLM